MSLRKDQSLDKLARTGNVAQFVSFAPLADGSLRQQYSRVTGFAPNHDFGSLASALKVLLRYSVDGTINLRSYAPDSPRSREFVYGIARLEDAVAAAERLAGEGLFVIANETVDINDGGVSGVIQGNIIEFAPDDTPRCVEKPGVASLPRAWGLALLKTVYGFRPDTETPDDSRLEFSIHPKPRGWKRSHTLAWEYEETEDNYPSPTFAWPNRFSRHIGDKAFGLLIADYLGLPVPKTTVFGRRVAPFAFGRPTGSLEVWIRTCPHEPDPGRYTTRKGWTDPFKLMAVEDRDHDAIASVLCQAAVPALYSGASIVTIDHELLIEGRSGEGDGLMLGKDRPEDLPPAILGDVEKAFQRLSKELGPVRFEWVHDGQLLWIVQLHRGETQTSSTVLVPGDAAQWRSFSASDGLEALRAFLTELPTDAGVTINGDIGLTSHLADLIRKAQRPARLMSDA
ncbi:hypothetical protein EOB36_00710 [Mesorhizobium sp. M6A.T.Cr.TU.017.01.1.1]|uniref:hypothetical protein n=1 Tax=Mesorhizobium sp. M6A.T.Cr.TU.017.01.1.1 TaxID=2496774 RepID=UPI000FD583F0|nr:hypothetical protein [Mesorhizobium sp. M6A.T.Cr.TU.017.01.1.1]RUV05199.1 hypothetical protein EOB36_00710 [Mesorhizobium sp. M6A.T.Cr.TU.017.01.1.1]